MGGQISWLASGILPDYVRKRNKMTKGRKERTMWDQQATTWDLPGQFVITSEEHLFVANEPSNRSYVHDHWCTREQVEFVMA